MTDVHYEFFKLLDAVLFIFDYLLGLTVDPVKGVKLFFELVYSLIALI